MPLRAANASHNKPPTQAENADAFVERLNRELADQSREQSAAGFAYATFINVDTEFLNAKANERVLEYFSGAVEKAKALQTGPAEPECGSLDSVAQARRRRARARRRHKRSELASITSKMEGMYGAAKYCPKGPGILQRIRPSSATSCANSRNYDELTDAWTGWHSTARPIRKDYVRFVELANEGARELGFADLGTMWRSNYDMPPDDFTKEAARLWEQVKPLYGSAALLRSRQAAENIRPGARARRASPFRRSCSETCGRNSGVRSIRWSSPTPAPPM